MNFFKWFLKTNPIHITILALGYIVMFLVWGEDGASDRSIAFPMWTLILIILVFGKYRYWKRVLKDKNYE